MPQSEAEVDNVDQIFAWQKMQRQLSKRLEDVLQKKTLWTDMEKKREYVLKRRGRMVSTHILHMFS